MKVSPIKLKGSLNQSFTTYSVFNVMDQETCKNTVRSKGRRNRRRTKRKILANSWWRTDRKTLANSRRTERKTLANSWRGTKRKTLANSWRRTERKILANSWKEDRAEDTG